MNDPAAPSTSAMLAAGMRGLCPRCRRGRLFSGFLKVADRCPACGLDFSGHDAGDGPAVAAIFILGFGVTGLAGFVEYLFAPPMWLHALLWLPLIGLGAVGLLQPLKGLTIALQYRFRAVDEPGRLGGT
ncbi:MAG: DUF983 domain-containing protein [Rhodospirillales bacterium]|nr:DUF983 domain-containing protein [Rhodospirillales bacterium]